MPRLDARLDTYGAVSTRLALLSDTQLAQLLRSARPLGAGHGGRTYLVEVDGRTVFAKRVPLTDLELRRENVMSTGNLFGLPAYYQYGVGSAGFGAWRELAVHTMTTNWVLSGRSQGFPLTYHWRVLPEQEPMADSAELQRELDERQSYWDGSQAVRHRLEAIARASAGLLLFIEYVPQTVNEWLTEQLVRGDAAVDAACSMLDRGLREQVAFMRAHGLVHYDVHFHNVLTDGQQLYVADYGLASHADFDLSAEEADFLREHQDYDAALSRTWLVNALVGSVCDTDDPRAAVRAYAYGARPNCGSRAAARIIRRDAPVAAVVNELIRTLMEETKDVKSPAAALGAALVGPVPGAEAS